MTITERDDERLLQIAVPPAAIIQPGIQVKIDTGTPTKVQYVACTPGECLAVGKINVEMIGRLKRGRTLLVTMINPRGKHVVFEISLMGFTAAYDGPAIDESQVGTHQEGQEDDLKRMADAAREELMSQAQKQDTQ